MTTNFRSEKIVNRAVVYILGVFLQEKYVCLLELFKITQKQTDCALIEAYVLNRMNMVFAASNLYNF